MKVHNTDKWFMFFSLPIVVGFLIGTPIIVIIYRLEAGFFTLVAGVPIWFALLLSFRDGFCPFVINEKGITSKMPFRNIFIAWDDMKYIQVGERRYQGKDFRFIMCFSKVPLKTVFIGREGIFARQNKKHFYIVYREGLLEEVLKYVDESRIKDVSRIKNNPIAEGLQDPATSRLGGKLGDFKKDKNWWDL